VEATPGGSDYVPTVDGEELEQILHWHQRAYAEARAAGATERTFDHLGATIVVPPEVMPVTPMARLLGEAVLSRATPATRMLDMGTGSGVNAVLAASRGATVLAVDINPRALEAARANARRNGVEALVEVRFSDVFSHVDGRFDIIVFDPPYRWLRPRDLTEAAMTDEGYGAMTRFFTQARRHLGDNAVMLISFGTSGDLGYLLRLMAGAGFSAEVVARTN
jgi:release factor glutamine methyltransferase